jgi:RND superfamily putative drug exporter
MSFMFALSGPLPPKEMGSSLASRCCTTRLLAQLMLAPILSRLTGRIACGFEMARTSASPDVRFRALARPA